MLEQRNFFELSGNLQTLEKLRWTPSGVPVRSGSEEHVSTAIEEGTPIRLSFSFSFIAIGETARLLQENCLGRPIFLSGILVSPLRRPAIELRVFSVKFERESIESI